MYFCGSHEDQPKVFSGSQMADICVSFVSGVGVRLSGGTGDKVFNKCYNCKNINKNFIISV